MRIPTVLALAAAALVPVASSAVAAEYAPGEVLVGYQPDTTAQVRTQVRGQVGARSAQPISPRTPAAERVVLPAGTSVPAAIARLRGNAAVRYVEPNWIVRARETSNDPLVTNGSLWGMTGTSGSRASAAWGAGAVGSPAVTVGIIDEGIDISHPDLAANIWRNPAEAQGSAGVDDDGNGYVDDVNGWDFANNDRTVYDGGTLDKHGTHVAGTIGGVGGNGIGVAGVNWRVTMVPAKFLGSNGGTIANAVRALDYLTDLRTRRGVNVVASNNSWGGGGFSQAMLDAINRSGDAGMLFVAAAGNGGSDGVGDNNDAVASYPSNYQCTAGGRAYDCVVAVAATTSTDTRSSFSNYGAVTVDLGAPGSGITSTLPGGTYGAYSGTSMATPHVTGAVALCTAVMPGITPADSRAALMNSAAPTTALAGITVSGGRLDVDAMRTRCGGSTPGTPPPPPSPPGAFGKTAPLDRATGLGTRVSLSWSTSAGATGYEVCVDTTNDNTCSGAWTATTSRSATARVSRRTTYYWQVRAVASGLRTDADSGAWWRFTTG